MKIIHKNKITISNVFSGTYRLWCLVNNNRISIECLALMQVANDYFDRRIKNLEYIAYYFEAYKYFFMNSEHKKEMSQYKFGNTFEETLSLNENNIQLYEAMDNRGCLRRLKSV